MEEALIEMYLAGVSVRRVEDITEVLWGTKVSPSTISELNKKAYVHIEDWPPAAGLPRGGDYSRGSIFFRYSRIRRDRIKAKISLPSSRSLLMSSVHLRMR